MTKKQGALNALSTDLVAVVPAWVGPLCGLTGAALFLAGTVCFVAYNWAAWGVLSKFALPLVGLLVCAAGAYFAGLQHNAGKVLSFACGLFVGLFWVVYGQVYQTGVFVYEFCLAWAVSLLPLAVLAGNRWLWLLWAAACNGYILSRWSLWMTSEYMWILILFNTLCFAASEWAARRRGESGWFSLFFLAAALWFSLLDGLGSGWMLHFWSSLGLMALLGLYAWRFGRGAAQLGFCALALDVLLAEEVISSLNLGDGILTVLAVMALFIGSGWAVYALTRGEVRCD